MFEWLKSPQRAIEDLQLDPMYEPDDEPHEGDLILGILSPYFRKVHFLIEQLVKELRTFAQMYDETIDTLPEEDARKLTSKYHQMHLELSILQDMFNLGVQREFESECPDIWEILLSSQFHACRGWTLVARPLPESPVEEEDPPGEVVFTPDEALSERVQKGSRDKKKMN